MTRPQTRASIGIGRMSRRRGRRRGEERRALACHRLVVVIPQLTGLPDAAVFGKLCLWVAYQSSMSACMCLAEKACKMT